MSNQITDINGWIEIKGNPISKVGVFPYSGAQVDPRGEKGLDPNKIYQVYRPEEELSDPECLASFRLVPWINDHDMLGPENTGLLSPDKKGIKGIVGEEIYYEAPYLKANLKIFSEKFSKIIKNDKKQLSIGYWSEYDSTSGVYEGTPYEFVQRKIRGNHVALVEDGRAGPDVAVLDSLVFTIDTRLIMEPVAEVQTDAAGDVSMSSLHAEIKALVDVITRFVGAKKAEAVEDAEDPETGEEKDKAEDSDKTEDSDTEKEKAAAMDSAMIKKLQKEMTSLKATMDSKLNLKSIMRDLRERDQLANNLSYLIGTFDHAEKTVDEVAAYGLKELKLQAPEGQEKAVLMGYLAGRRAQPTQDARTAAMDTADMSAMEELDNLYQDKE